jgi:ABC-2 type transport system permease protein
MSKNMVIIMIRRLLFLQIKTLLPNKGKSKTTGAYAVKLFILAAAALYMLAILCYGIVTFFSVFLEFAFTNQMGWMYFLLLAIFVITLSVLTSVFAAYSLLFTAKDNDLLLSLPIAIKDILCSRIAVIFLIEYLTALIVEIPVFILWFQSAYFHAAGAVFFLLGSFLLPFAAMVITLLLAWIIAMVVAYLPFRNVLTLLFSIGFLAAYFYGVTALQGTIGTLLSQGVEISQVFRNTLPPFYAFGKSIAAGDALSFFSFALWMLLPTSLMFFVIFMNYRKFLSQNHRRAYGKYHGKVSKQQSPLRSLVKKELLLIWSKPVILLNTCLGTIMMLIAAIVLLFRGVSAIEAILPFASLHSDLSLPYLTTAGMMMLGMMNTWSASCISLEGNRIWIAQSIPVPTKRLLHAKIVTQMLLTSVPCLLLSICCGVIITANGMEWLTLLWIPQLFAAFTASAGVAINLVFPKLQWNNEIAVVKQGLSAIVALFGGMALLLGLAFLYVRVLENILSLQKYLWVCGLLFFIAFVGILRWIGKYGVRRFASLI